jgi:ubiquinone/menaquinone biosynthesis C-methylase UbiE
LDIVSKFTDQQYLKDDQYKDSSNLDARATIHNRFSTNPQSWTNWVFDHLLNLPDDANILELGCGPAYLWKENIQRIPAGWRITLSDLSSGMLDAAWRNLVVTGRAFQFKEIDAQSIPFENETFDAVVANHMLYHVPDRPKAIAEIKRVLKPGGFLVATTLGKTHMQEMTGWMRQTSADKNLEPFSLPFSLENGLEQLRPFFSSVRLERFEDHLQVTEVEPIIAYLASGFQATEVLKEEVEKLRHELQTRIENEKSIYISKDSGLFEAVK